MCDAWEGQAGKLVHVGQLLPAAVAEWAGQPGHSRQQAGEGGGAALWGRDAGRQTGTQHRGPAGHSISRPGETLGWAPVVSSTDRRILHLDR